MMTGQITATGRQAQIGAPLFLPLGDRAMTVSFGDTIDAATNDTVIRLADSLRDYPFDGFEEALPTYRSLLIIYDPLLISGDEVERIVADRIKDTSQAKPSGRRWNIPVHYGGAAALDLESLASEKNVSVEELISLHSGTDYRVYMIGFAPGFAYLGGLPKALHVPRLPKPRQLVPAGAVGIGGQQASVNSVAGPSGWRFLGSTPVKAFDPAREAPFLFRAGDLVRFVPISEAEANDLSRRVELGETVVLPELVA